MLTEFKENLANNKELILKVKVFPGASHNEIKERLADGTLKVNIAAPAEDNKANKALIKYLASELDVRRYQVEIISGASDRLKVIRVGR